MRFYIFILILVPILTARAASPFVSVGVQPTFILTSNENSQVEGFDIGKTFTSIGGNATVGATFGRAEYFVRFVWNRSNSYTTISSRTEIDSIARNTLTTTDRDRILESKLMVGGHWQMAEGSAGRVKAFLGGGMMIGYSDWVTHHRFEVQSYVFQEQQVYDVAQYEDTETLNSTFDYGGFVELGATLNIYRKLYLEFLTQGELHHASYSDWEMEFNSENEGSYLIVEPSFSLGLRWEMR